jgi:DNA-binding LacI/PurR family transcriptional regulator
MPQALPMKTYAQQAAELLRQQLLAGTWRGKLPPERQLCQRLQVARNTLRRALKSLEQEGLLAPGARALGRQIKARPPQVRADRFSGQVVLLSPTGLPFLQANALEEVDRLRVHLFEAGFRLETVTSRAFHVGHPAGLLAELVRKWPQAIWVLYHSTRAIQQWFARQGLPAVILGHPHPGVDLPSVDKDVAAAAQHAVATLWAKGHRNIVLLRPRQELGGFVVMARALQDFMERRGDAFRRPVAVQHDGTKRGLCRVLDQLLVSRPPPLAILTCLTDDVVTTLTYLIHRGIRVPGAVSLIYLLDDPIMDCLVPTVDRYRANSALLVKRLAGLILKIAAGETGPCHSVRVMCDYCRGETVGPA